MESQPIPNPLQVYLETTVIIDLCLKGELRHGDAEELVEIFESHQSPQKRVDVYVSPWARMEAHSRIYEKLLEQREGITRESYFRSSKGEKKRVNHLERSSLQLKCGSRKQPAWSIKSSQSLNLAQFFTTVFLMPKCGTSPIN